MRRLISHWVAGFAISIGCVGGAGASDLYLLPGDPEKGQALHQARCTVCHQTQFGGMVRVFTSAVPGGCGRLKG